jgi:uncharacterized protein (DUF1697 family)
MKKYVALLRGINVGGNKRIPMKELKKCLEEIGLINVKTLLTSGNVIFECDEKALQNISSKIEQTFGFKVEILIFPFQEIIDLVNSNPFHNIDVTEKTRLYVTFFNEINKSKLKIPFITADKSFKILQITENAIISILDLDKIGTIDGMKILEKEFGKKLTTRNFNTVLKLSKL